MINSDVKWGDYLYESFEILLFALRGNLNAFFSMGLPDEVVDSVPFQPQMFLQLFSTPCLSLLEHSGDFDNPRVIEVSLNVLASLLSSYRFSSPFPFM